ncbi:phosphatase PAP2 family protein [Candidatus Roizmanbacteria bacterium]|nr:phosphatase PAP2 family protein [Candidatus Roizmanbacteria bacterium]
MLNVILQLDSLITQLLSALIPHNYFFNLFFSFFSMKGGSIGIWIVIVVLLIIFEEKINRKFILYFLVILAISSFTVFGIKNIVKRNRPISTYTCPKDYSFPSGHATTAFAAATILSVFDKKRRVFYYAVAVLIAFSRIYLECHYILDVIGGGFIGYFVSKTILQLSPMKKPLRN